MITITGALIGVSISFAALALSILILVLKIGKLIGKLESGMLQNSKDISALWEHQRTQDDKISNTEQAISRIDENISWIKKTLERVMK